MFRVVNLYTSLDANVGWVNELRRYSYALPGIRRQPSFVLIRIQTRRLRAASVIIAPFVICFSHVHVLCIRQWTENTVTRTTRDDSRASLHDIRREASSLATHAAADSAVNKTVPRTMSSGLSTLHWRVNYAEWRQKWVTIVCQRWRRRQICRWWTWNTWHSKGCAENMYRLIHTRFAEVILKRGEFRTPHRILWLNS